MFVQIVISQILFRLKNDPQIRANLARFWRGFDFQLARIWRGFFLDPSVTTLHFTYPLLRMMTTTTKVEFSSYTDFPLGFVAYRRSFMMSLLIRR